MFPVLINSPVIEYPLSGNVTQDISPAFFAAMKGIPEVEREVVTSVASYGSQLSTLADAVLAVAEAAGVKGPAVEKLRALQTDVNAARARAKGAVEARVKQAAADLARVRSATEEAG